MFLSSTRLTLMPPGIGGFVGDGAHLGVDDIAAGEALVKLEIADDASQRSGGEVLDGDHGLLNTVGVELGVGDLEVDDGVSSAWLRYPW